MTFRETWHAARADPSSGELTNRQWGKPPGLHVETGWWVDPRSFGVGITADTEPEYGRLAMLGIHLGPFTWAATLWTSDRKD